MTEDVPELVRLIREDEWGDAMHRLRSHEEEATFVDPESGFTPLHEAIRTNAVFPDGRRSANERLGFIRSLTVAHATAASRLCTDRFFTPLHYACLTHEQVADDSGAVKALLEEAPSSAYIPSRAGQLALELHIASFSIHRQKEATSHRNPSTMLPILLEFYSQPSPQQQDRPQYWSRALEVLYECNSEAILERMEVEEALANTQRREARRTARLESQSRDHHSVTSAVSSVWTHVPTTPSASLAAWWVWECALLIFRQVHKQSTVGLSRPVPPFHVLHAATRITECPLVFLVLALRSNSRQVTEPNLEGNLPLHVVASWTPAGSSGNTSITSQDEAFLSRKAMAISALVKEHPMATRIKNHTGQTPLSLALATQTPWAHGVRQLTNAGQPRSASAGRSRAGSTSVVEQSARSLLRYQSARSLVRPSIAIASSPN